MGGNAGESYHAVSLSGGKDSTAMLLLMIERDMPVDVVLTADTGMEFPEMYEHLQKLDDLLCRERGIHITTLRHPKGFEWLMFEEPKVKQSSIENRQKLGVPLYGNGWPGPRVRWCTGTLKTHLIHKEVNRLKKLRAHHPELWARLREMDRRAIAQFGHNPLGQFTKNWTVEQLERRFANEDRQISVSVREER